MVVGIMSTDWNSCYICYVRIHVTCMYCILYFAWEDQSDSVYHILHTVLINCITVLYESYSTVMQLIGQIQYSYVENLFKECYVNNTL